MIVGLLLTILLKPGIEELSTDAMYVLRNIWQNMELRSGDFMSSIRKLNSMFSLELKPWEKLRPSNELTIWHFTENSKILRESGVLDC